jgi:cellobiose transport system substrate-binding protein
MVDNITTIYTQMLAQSSQQYFDKSGKYTGDQPYMKQIWDETVKFHTQDLTAKIPMWSQGWVQGMGTGLIASFVGAAWLKGSIEQNAPNTKGLWRVAMAPGGAGNSGGSQLGISKYCLHPQEALQVIEWLQSAQNQLIAYKDTGLYPSALGALNSPAMHQAEPFFGGQDTAQIFAASAKEVLPRYLSPNDGAPTNGFDDQLNFVEFQNKNPEQAWTDAQIETQRALLR